MTLSFKAGMGGWGRDAGFKAIRSKLLTIRVSEQLWPTCEKLERVCHSQFTVLSSETDDCSQEPGKIRKIPSSQSIRMVLQLIRLARTEYWRLVWRENDCVCIISYSVAAFRKQLITVSSHVMLRRRTPVEIRTSLPEYESQWLEYEVRKLVLLITWTWGTKRHHTKLTERVPRFLPFYLRFVVMLPQETCHCWYVSWVTCLGGKRSQTRTQIGPSGSFMSPDENFQPIAWSLRKQILKEL